MLYKELLCHHSKFFRKAFDRTASEAGSFKETEEQTMVLPEENVEAFELFHLWLEQQRLEMPFGDKPHELSVKKFLNLYALGDQCDIKRLRNLAISKLASYKRVKGFGPSAEDIASIWSELQSNSPLCRYLVNEYALYRYLGDDEVEAMQCLPQDFLFRVLMVTLETLRLHPDTDRYIKATAFTSATEELISTSQFPKEVLVNMVILNMQTLRTFYTSSNDTLLNAVKYGLRVCEYHEHQSTQAAETCTWRDQKIGDWFED